MTTRKKPGPKSAAEAATQPRTTAVERPEPPSELTPAEAREWRKALAPLPAEWVSGAALGTLADLCRTRVRIDQLARAMNEMQTGDGSDTNDFLVLLRESEKQMRLARALASSLRMTPQSRMDRHAAGTAARPKTARRPWD